MAPGFVVPLALFGAILLLFFSNHRALIVLE